MQMPVLRSERLVIRPFEPEDLGALHRLLDVELAEADTGGAGPGTREARRRWLEWTILGYEAFARLHQAPLGDRAIALGAGGELVGVCGLVPVLDAFGRLPVWRGEAAGRASDRTRLELGLYWALAPAQRGRGYATEAARALAGFAFGTLRVARVVATTQHGNLASIAVMERLGMRIERNPDPEPPWLQVVGVLDVAP